MDGPKSAISFARATGSLLIQWRRASFRTLHREGTIKKPNGVRILAITIGLIAAAFGLNSTEMKETRSSRMERSPLLLQHTKHSAAFCLAIGRLPRQAGGKGILGMRVQGSMEFKLPLREAPREWECKNHRSVTGND